MTATGTNDSSLVKRKLLEERLMGRHGGTPLVGPVTRRADAGAAPLSVTQEQLWYFTRLVPDIPVYNEAVTIRKEGSFDHEVFVRAFAELIRRHEAWRTTFVISNGEPVQIVNAPPDFPLPLIDLSQLTRDEAEDRAAEIVGADAREPYDLEHGPLVRPRLFRFRPDHHRLYLGLHHLIFDGVTLYRVILPELVQIYDDLRSGRPSSLPQPSVQYSDYAVWERRWMSSPAVAERMAWWKRHLAAAPALEMPLDRARPSVQRFAGEMVPFTLERDMVEGLRRLGQDNSATLFQVLATGFAAVLHRYSGQDDVVFATLGDMRQRPELRSLVGYSLTPLIVRADLREEPSFLLLLSRLREELIDGLDHLVPFARLVQELRPARDGRSNPIFQVSLVLEPAAAPVDPEWTLHQMEVGIGNVLGIAKFDLTLECDERPEGHISGRLSYNSDIFSQAFARRLGQHYHRLMAAILADPSQPVTTVGLADPEESRQLDAWNATRRDFSANRPLHELITAQARRSPSAVALVFGNEQVTYQELERRADLLALRLRAAGAGRGVVVALCVERSVDMVVGLLAILKSGAAYLALNPRHPVDRLTFMVQETSAKILLTQRPLASLLAGATAVTVMVDDPGHDADQVGHDAETSAPTEVTLDDLAYIVYTSGSTGRPKGVRVRHGHVLNYVNHVAQQPGLVEDDVMLAITTYVFDVSVADIFAPLSVGARIVIASSDEIMDMRLLRRLIEAAEPTCMYATPTTWKGLIASGWNGSAVLRAVTGGEKLTEDLAAKLLPRVQELWNAYGPTETTVYATYEQILSTQQISVGRPIANMRTYVLDSHGSHVPIGVTGEIYIAGAGVTEGYCNRPEETASRFLPDAFGAGGTMYRTGDLGRFLPDGRLQVLGRADDQMKVRGFRIEPGEIEAALLARDDIRSAAVIAREDVEGDPRLVAYVVPRGDMPLTTDLRSSLRRFLPEYMVPSTFVPMEAIPTTSTGKLDLAALPAPQPGPGEDASPDFPQGSSLEQEIARIWARALNVAHVGPHQTFFDLGGHSLLAVRTLLAVEQELGVEIPLSALFEGGSTVSGMAAIIERRRASDATQDSAGKNQAARKLFFVHPHVASVPAMRHFAELLGPELPIQALVPQRHGFTFDRTGSIEKLTLPLLDAVRTSQPHGPYLLAGYSLGGLLAYELAAELRAAGENVAWLGLLDAASPTVYHRRPSQLELLVRYARRGPSALLDQCLYVIRREFYARRAALRHRPEDAELFDYHGAFQLARKYRPAGHDAPLDVFATDAAVTGQRFGRSLGWEHLHKGPLSAYKVPGNHDSILREPNVSEVARIFCDRLAASAPSVTPRS